MQLKPWSPQGKTSLNWNAGRTHKIDTWRYGFFFGGTGGPFKWPGKASNECSNVVQFSGIFWWGKMTGYICLNHLKSPLPKCCFHSRFGG